MHCPYTHSHHPSRKTPGRIGGSAAVWCFALCGLALLGCKREQKAAAPPTTPEVIVTAPVTGQITDYADFPGHTEAIKNVTITARVSGYLEKVFFKEGSEVKQGDLLFLIDQRPYSALLHSAEASRAEAKAALELAQTQLVRAEQLASGNAIASSDYDQAKNAVAVARARVMSSEAAVETAKLNFDYCSIRSPIDGQISRQLIDPGNMVQAGQTAAGSTALTTVVSLDPIYAYFDVDERTMLELRRLARIDSQNAAMPVFLGLADQEEEGKYPHEGLLNFVDNRVDPMSGTLRLRGVFPNKDRLLTPGLYARIRLPTSEPYTALMIPEQALGTDQGRKFVYVVNDKNEATYRRVKVGRQQDGLRVIEKGLDAGDRVVVSGLQRILRPGITVIPKQMDSAAKASESAPPTDSTPKTPTDHPTTR